MVKKYAPAVLFILALAWLAWPFNAAYVVLLAAGTGDIATLERKVDWASVRAGIKEDVRNSGTSSLAGGSAIGSMIARKMAPSAGNPRIEEMVDRLVTPETFATLAKIGGAVATEEDGAAPRRINRDRIKWAFLSDPMSFRVDMAVRDGPVLTLILGWSGNWTLERIELPVDEMKKHVHFLDKLA